MWCGRLSKDHCNGAIDLYSSFSLSKNFLLMNAGYCFCFHNSTCWEMLRRCLSPAGKRDVKLSITKAGFDVDKMNVGSQDDPHDPLLCSLLFAIRHQAGEKSRSNSVFKMDASPHLIPSTE